MFWPFRENAILALPHRHSLAQGFVYRVYLANLLVRVDTVQWNYLSVVPLHFWNLALGLLETALFRDEGIVLMLED